MKVDKLDRVAIITPTMGEVMEFLTDLTGAQFKLGEVEHLGVKYALSDQGLEVATPPTKIEVVKDAQAAPHITLVFKVSDMEEARQWLKKKGIRIRTEVKGGVNEFLLDSRDVHGLTVALCEYPGDSIVKASTTGPPPSVKIYDKKLHT